MTTLAMPLNLDRPFQLWSYSVSHSVLLLRSNIAPGIVTRMDLMFRSVTAMKLRHRYDRLVVDVMPAHDVADALELGDTSNRFVFTLGPTRDDQGYVVAGILYLSEDDLSDGHRSTIDHPDLADHIIASGTYRQ